MVPDLRRIVVGGLFVLAGLSLGGLNVFREGPPNPWGLFLALTLVALGVAYVVSDGTISEAMRN